MDETRTPVRPPDPIAPVLSRLHREIEKVEERTDAVLEEALQGLAENGCARLRPLVAGWSIQLEPDGRHRLVPFGNVRHGFKGAQAGWREPQLEWHADEEHGELLVEAEVPGVKKSDIDVAVDPHLIRIRADGAERRYQAEIAPGVPLKMRRPKAQYKDGILRLRVRLGKKDKGRPKAVKVKG